MLVAHVAPHVPVCPAGAELDVHARDAALTLTCHDAASRKPDGRMVSWRDGVLREDTSFELDVRHGLSRTWDERGRMQNHMTSTARRSAPTSR